MKAIFNIIIITGCTLAVPAVKAQALYNDEPITAETLLQMQEGGNGLFAISPVRIQANANGFSVQWQTINENDITSFELEAGESKKSFTRVTKMEAGNTARPANLYQVDLKSSILQNDKIYLRVKINFTNGASRYTDESVVKMRKAK